MTPDIYYVEQSVVLIAIIIAILLVCLAVRSLQKRITRLNKKILEMEFQVRYLTITRNQVVNDQIESITIEREY